MHNLTPLDYYHQQVRTGIIASDSEQLIALQQLQTVYLNLLSEKKQRDKFYAAFRKPKQVQGVYLWGGVGIGKTYLLDCFYNSLPITNKLRMHFHQFMKFIHQELTAHQGEKNPLDMIAKQLARKTLVLCFDELFVSDITDAMILGRLFKALTQADICLVATSNVHPDNLYLRGLQRELFLPTIALLKQITTVMHLPSSTDYRLRHFKNVSIFHTPNDNIAETNMEKSFDILCNSDKLENGTIKICSRPIRFRKKANDVIWFDFNAICGIPRNQHDYLAIAEKYKTVLISNIPQIKQHDKNTVNLFVKLIDVFYDSRTRIICSSEVPINDIYIDGHMKFEFERTLSRLQEMQSEAYFCADDHAG